MKLPEWLKYNKLYQANIPKNANSEDPQPQRELKEVTSIDDATLIGTKWLDGEHELHKVFLDIDVEHVYKESLTEGHAHLILNINLTRSELDILTSIFVKLGITGNGNYNQIIRDGQMFLRV